MRVAVLLEQLMQPIPGGTGRYTFELTRALADSRGDDQLTGWTARQSADPTAAAVPGIAGPRRLPLPRQLANKVWPRTTKLPGTGPRGADVVFAPTPFAPPRARTPLVVAIHDAVAWTAPDTMTPRSLAWHRRVIANAVRTADAIVVPTEATRAALDQHLRLRDNVHVTGEGVSETTTTVPPDAATRVQRLQLPRRFLLMVATMEPRKGLDIALRALADEATGDIPLVIVGPPGWGAVSAEAAAYGLSDARVRVLGRLDDADLATAYSRAAAVLVPSRDEGFGLPAAEAMAHGVTPLVSSAPALVEVVGDAGIVTPIGDRKALAAAIHDVLARTPQQQQAAATRAVAKAQEHTWTRTAERTWSVLRAVADASTA